MLILNIQGKYKTQWQKTILFLKCAEDLKRILSKEDVQSIGTEKSAQYHQSSYLKFVREYTLKVLITRNL